MSCFSCIGKCTHFHLNEVLYDSSDSESSGMRKQIQKVLPKTKNSPQNVPTYSRNLSSIPVVDVNHEDLILQYNTSVHPLTEGDYVVVRFLLKENVGERRWIGQIQRINENDTFLIEFFKAKLNTKFYPGFLYTTYSPPDEHDVYKTQVLYVLPKPTIFQRAMKFVIHCDKLLCIVMNKVMNF